MGDPMISLANGVLSWSFDRAVAFAVRIDGQAYGSDGLYRETALFIDAPEYIGKPLDIEIEPITSGVSSGAFRVRTDAEHKRLSLLPVTGFTVEDGALLWKPVLGAAGYMVVDIERNATVVADTYYEMHSGKPIYGVYPEYDGGHWALFEFIAEGGEVKNIVFDEPSIKNVLRLKYYPIDASVATVAHINRGSITRATVVGAAYSAAGGTVCGICSHNFGTVSCCSVSGEFVQGNTGLDGQGCCEMAGIVTENCRGGIVERNAAELTVRGMRLAGYINIGTVGGIVAVNRRGARVRGNAVGSSARTIPTMKFKETALWTR